jgi:hypothetical protein
LKEVYGAQIKHRGHREPYLWRIFIFDDIAFVSAYLYFRENDKRANVYKIKKGENSLYTVFDKYFDYLWVNYDPEVKDDIKKWEEWS